MDYKNYKHAFQQIRFSEHLEEDILSNLEKRNNKRTHTKLFSRVIFTSAAALCALTLIVTLNRLDSLDCDLLSENSLAELDNISNISICQTTTTENQKVEIPDHEMVILDPASEIEKNKIVSPYTRIRTPKIRLDKIKIKPLLITIIIVLILFISLFTWFHNQNQKDVVSSELMGEKMEDVYEFAY